MRMNWKQMIGASFLTCGILLSGVTVSHAEPISSIQTQMKDLESEIQKIDNRIVESMVKIEEIEKKVSENEKKVKKAKEGIKVAEEQYNRSLEIYMDRLRSIQTNGDFHTNLLLILLSSEGISDFLHRTYAVSQILESDQLLLESLNEKQAELEKKKKSLDEILKKLENQKTELNNEKTQMEIDKQKVLQEIERLKEEKRQEELRQERARQEAERRALMEHQTSFPSSTAIPQSPIPTPPVSIESANTVISKAYQFLGVPYVWGGTTPNGFDCSGLTQYVYRSVGVYLPRVARDQQNFGTQIPITQIQPGDLVFFGRPAHHVGIYIGNGKYLHAPQTGDVVKVSNLNLSSVSSVSRVLP